MITEPNCCVLFHFWRTTAVVFSVKVGRFLKKIEKDERYLTSCLNIAKEAEHKVSNNILPSFPLMLLHYRVLHTH